MTPNYYYDSKANKFYGPLDRMPPDKNDYFGFMGEDEVFDVESYDNDIESFLRYLSSAPTIPHIFTGHSRVVPEGEIEWRYEVDDKSDPFGQRWVEVTKHTYDNFHDTLPKRKVAVPIEAKEVSSTTMRRKFERLIGERERPDGSKVSMPINESPGYTSTSGEEVEPSNRNWWCHSCKREVKDEDVTEGITHKECGQPVQYLNAQIFGLTAQPDKRGETFQCASGDLECGKRCVKQCSFCVELFAKTNEPENNTPVDTDSQLFQEIKWEIAKIQFNNLGMNADKTIIEANPATHRIAEYVYRIVSGYKKYAEDYKELANLRSMQSPPSPQTGEKPRKICYCGSLRVAKEAFQKAEYESVINGDIALLPCCMFVDIQREYGAESDYKQKADDLHKRKIDICDEVFVLNVGGYIGESTRSEIEYATKIGKPIKYLEP